jgi:hypothetical protein
MGGVLMAFSIALSACAGTSTPGSYPMTALQRAQVEKVLRDGKDQWRLAIRSDSRDTSGLRDLSTHAPPLEPYFAIGPARGGVNDFAATLIKDSTFRVFYFRADNGSYLPAQEVTSVDWLRDGFVSIHGDTLDVALLRSDEIFSFAWSPEKKHLQLIEKRGDVTKQ